MTNSILSIKEFSSEIEAVIYSLKERVGAVKQSRSEQFLGLYSFIGGTGMFSILAHTIPNSS